MSAWVPRTSVLEQLCRLDEIERRLGALEAGREGSPTPAFQQWRPDGAQNDAAQPAPISRDLTRAEQLDASRVALNAALDALDASEALVQDAVRAFGAAWVREGPPLQYCKPATMGRARMVREWARGRTCTNYTTQRAREAAQEAVTWLRLERAQNDSAPSD